MRKRLKKKISPDRQLRQPGLFVYIKDYDKLYFLQY